jgi:hypothetical protein
VSQKYCTPDNFDMFFGHFFLVILDILKIFCSNKHQIITDLLKYLDPIKLHAHKIKQIYFPLFTPVNLVDILYV